MANKEPKKKYKYVTRTVTMPDGTRKYVYGKTKAEAEAKVAEIKAQIAGGVDLRNDTTFGELAKLWVEKYRAPYIRPSTLRNERSGINAHLMPTLATMKVKDITPIQVQSVIAAVIESSPTRAGAVLRELREILNLAVDLGCIAKNPVPITLKVPKKEQTREKSILSVDLERKILTRLLPVTLERLFFQVALHTGCRRGEILALDWKNIDLENGIIYIRQNVALDEKSRSYLTDKLKTSCGRRDLPISDVLRKELTEWAKWKGQEGLLFLSRTRKKHLFNIGNFEAMWKTIKAACAEFDPEYAENFTSHALRHTYITRLFEAGLDVKEIQALAGHDDVTTTLNVYTHYSAKERQEDTFNKVRDILAKKENADTADNVIQLPLRFTTFFEHPAEMD